MFVRIGDITINEDFIGYVKLESRNAYLKNEWFIVVRCNNDNQYSDEIAIKYPSEEDARKVYEEIVQILLQGGK
jgi:hypothetical protein